MKDINRKLRRKAERGLAKDGDKSNRANKQREYHSGKAIRRVKNGWIIGDKVKMGYGSLIFLIFIAAVVVFFTIGVFYQNTQLPWAIIPSIPDADAASWRFEVAKTVSKKSYNEQVKATGPPLMSITRSKSCQIVASSDIDGCISNKYLVESYDNTIPKYSGYFVEKNGDLVREKPLVKNHWLRYPDIKKTIVAVDPDGNWAATSTSQQIIIEPINYVYTRAQTNTNGTFSYYQKVFIDECHLARVAADKDLIQKVVVYMYKGCNGEKPMDKVTVVVPKTPIRLSDYTEYKYRAWQKDASEKCKTLCIESLVKKNMTSPKNMTISLGG
jgi:hypothetical protein